MEIRTHFFHQDIEVFCKKAESFPLGVKPAFQYMHSLVDFNPQRMQLGLSKPLPDGGMDYWAASQEIVKGEFSKHGLPCMTIPSGEYKYIMVTGYMEDISTIGKAFRLLLDEEKPESDILGVEWYLSKDEVWCMLKI